MDQLKLSDRQFDNQLDEGGNEIRGRDALVVLVVDKADSEA